MTPEQFCYWLQGYFEISEETRLLPKQVEIIQEHLQKVFNKDLQVATVPFVQGLKHVGFDLPGSDFRNPPSNTFLNDNAQSPESLLMYPDGPPASC